MKSAARRDEREASACRWFNSSHSDRVGADFISFAATCVTSHSSFIPSLLLFSRNPLSLGLRLILRCVFASFILCCEDYERSSCKYMSYGRNFQNDDLEAFKIVSTNHKSCDTIEPYLIGGTWKGGGSGCGGEVELEWMVGSDRLSDVIAQVTALDRSI